MKVVVVLLLSVFIAGCNAEMEWQNPPSRQVNMMKNAFWDYVAKMTMTAEDSLKHIRHSELGQEVNTLISQSAEAVNKFSDALRTQVAPLTQDLMMKVSTEAVQLKEHLEKQMSAISTSLQPYAEELASELEKQVKELKKDSSVYAEAMDPEVLRTTMLHKSEELKMQLERSVSQLQAQLVPFTEEMKQKVDQTLEEFQRSLVPLAQSFETQLNQKTEEIQQSLTAYGEELRAKLDSDAHNLKRQLDDLWKSFAKITQ